MKLMRGGYFQLSQSRQFHALEKMAKGQERFGDLSGLPGMDTERPPHLCCGTRL